MNEKIYKYDIPIEEFFSIEMPEHSKILTLQVQRSVPRIWALAEIRAGTVMEKRHFMIKGTGHAIDTENHEYIGTFQQNCGYFIWHLFELT